MSRHFAITFGKAFGLSIATLLCAYLVFRWLLINYQTRRLGHPNPFVIGPEIDAMLLALLAAGIVFLWVVKRAKRTGS